MPLDDPNVLQSILSEAFHPASTLRKILKSTFGDKAYRQFSKTISAWRWPLWGVALEDIMAEKASGWERGGLFGGSDRREDAPPNFTMVEVGLKKERPALKDGGMIVKAKEGTLVLSVEPGWQCSNISLYSLDAQKDLAERFFREVEGWISKHNFYKGQKISSTGKFLDLSKIDYDDVVLPEKTQRDIFVNIRQMVERMGEYDRFGIPCKRGVILAGPPGCGKTLTARILAKNLPCTFIWANVRDIAEHGFEGIYEQARELAPTVVLMEDADGFGIDRRLGGLNPRLSELLNLLDGVEENKGVITMLSSNYAEMLDCALADRPGRFDLKVFIGPPGPNEAKEILRRSLEKRNVVFKGNPGILHTVAANLVSKGASGAHVVDVINTAMALAVERGRGAGKSLIVEEKDLAEAAVAIGERIAQADESEKALAQTGVFKWGQWGPGWKFGTKE